MEMMQEFGIWAKKNGIIVDSTNLTSSLQQYISQLSQDDQAEMEKGIDPKTERLNITEYVKILRNLEKNVANPNIEDLGRLSIVARQDKNLEILFNEGTPKVLMDIMNNTKENHVLELAFWALAEIIKQPQQNSIKFLQNQGNVDFIVQHLGEKHPTIINAIAIKILIDLSVHISPEKKLEYLEIVVPKHVHSTKVTLQSYTCDYFNNMKLIPYNTESDLTAFSLLFILSCVEACSKHSKERFFEIVNRVPLSTYRSFLEIDYTPTKKYAQLVLSVIDPENFGLKTSSPSTSDLRKCYLCEKEETLESKLQNCDRCQLACYCSEECQVKHWDSHKVNCVSN